jgi:glyoxylase-like metal-dependent hydrolase (beta-lactamase superfamily II)
MQAITENVQIEDSFPGVTLGVIITPRGLIQIDAPPSPEDARTWRASLMNLGGGMERVLINLDAHPDRTLGARAMDCTVIAHEKTAQTFRSRPTTFKAQGEETGADWESIAGLGSVRWAPPEIAFAQHMTLYWDESPVILEHHPGPAYGAIWVILPAQKIVFIGDAVLKNQPPFLASANFPAWIESINLLFSPAFRGYTVVSSRGGVVTSNTIKNQLDFLKYARDKLDKLSTKKPNPVSTEKLATSLLTHFKAPAARHKQYAQRLRYGTHHYITRHYHHSSSRSYED